MFILFFDESGSIPDPAARRVKTRRPAAKVLATGATLPFDQELADRIARLLSGPFDRSVIFVVE